MNYIIASVVLFVVFYRLAGRTFDLLSQSPQESCGLFVVIFIPVWMITMLIVADVNGDIE